MSRVDVVIPCYRYGHLLRGCVESVLSQPGVEVRALIIDDTSPDNTPEVGAQLAAEDSRVEYRRHAFNKGHIATYNEGLLGWVSGDYCVLLSADDLLTPGALSRAAAVMDARPEVGLVYGRDIRLQADQPLPQAKTDSSEYQITSGPKFLQRTCSTGYNPIPTPSVVTRTCLQKQVGGYRPELPHSGDMEMWMRFAAIADIADVQADQAYYRVHGQNMHQRLFGTAFAEISQRWKAFEYFFREFGLRIADTVALQQLAARAIATDALDCAYEAFLRRDAASSRQLADLVINVCPEARSWPLYHAVRRMLWVGPTTYLAVRGLLRKSSVQPA